VRSAIASALTLDAPAEELDALVDVAHTGLLWREHEAERPDDLLGFGDERLGVAPVARHADDKVVGVSDEPVVRLTVASPFGSLRRVAHRLPRPRVMRIERGERAGPQRVHRDGEWARWAFWRVHRRRATPASYPGT
jgi:hypothetical protein